MTRKLLITGRPRSGKTTLIKRIVHKLALPAGGFYTAEIRERGQRVGFKIITLEDEEAVFAHVNFKTSERLGKYGLDLSALETVGLDAVREALRARRLVVLDEIGPMELRSATFRKVVRDAFDSRVPILATVTARPFPFTNALKRHRGVTLIEVRRGNREQLVSELADQFSL
ncbi:MAG: AAA family ATPase [Verrucomicrobia bacterium]|nr:MAG: AAA family ATPase [Verrucomicrobiota bacterium]